MPRDTCPSDQMSQGLLTLSQWLSPNFPLGSFAYSHGLEWAVRTGDVHDARSLRLWLNEALDHGAGWNDAVLLAYALRCESPVELAQLADLASALAASRERHAETLAQGTALLRTVAALKSDAADTRHGLPDRTAGHSPDDLGAALPEVLPLPVALGWHARGLGLAPQTVLALFLQSFCGNLVVIAVRFVPLGQSEGQAVLQALNGKIAQIAARASLCDLDEIGGAFLRGDLAAMHHETLETRIFRT